MSFSSDEGRGAKVRAWRAARTASLLTAVAFLLLLSRSEIRNTTLGRPGVVVGLAGALWFFVFLIAWRRSAKQRL